MSASMVRLGGILVFVLIAVGIIGAFVASNKVVAIIFGLIQTGILMFIFWSTKGLFNSRNYRTADVAIMGIVVLLALMWAFSLIGGSGIGAIADPKALTAALGIVGIISLLVLLAWLVFFIWFSLGAMGFGGVGGGGLWKAIGILYVVALGLLILTVLLGIIAVAASSQGLAGLMAITGLIGILVFLAAWICHGIGLITGAGKMEKAV